MQFSIKREKGNSFSRVVKKTKQQLSFHGFGIVNEMDVQKIMQEKLGMKMEKYLILGVCQPQYASQVLRINKELGVFLPCNVIIYEDKKKVYVGAIQPNRIMKSLHNPQLSKLSVTVQKLLKQVVLNI